MIRLRRFASRLQAEHAAMFLRRNDINAIVVGDYVQVSMGAATPKMLQVELMLLDADRRDEAEALLLEFDSEPIELDPDWETESQPELAGLDLSQFDLSCAFCGYDLAGLEEAGVCPECAAAYDHLGLIVARHGPEALEALYAGVPALAWVKRDRCRECGGDITNLPTRGRCPNCGRLFDKDAERTR